MVASCHVKDALSAMTMLFFGLVVLVNIGIRAGSSQRDLTRSRAELNTVTYADHMEDGLSKEAAIKAYHSIFKTTCGKMICREMFDFCS